MTTEDDIRAASDRFYDAIQQMVNGDAEAMSDIWSHRDDVMTMHRIGGREVGWEEVRDSWESIADISEGGEVDRTDQFIRLVGESAYELVTEQVSWSVAGQQVSGEFRGTNISHLEDGDWKIVHHHVDTEEEFIEILQSLDDDE